MTSDDERMALLAGRPLEALEPDEREQVRPWTELLADEDVGGARARSRGSRGRLDRRGRASADPQLGDLDRPDDRLVGAAAAGRSGRGRRHRGRGLLLSAATPPTGPTRFAVGTAGRHRAGPGRHRAGADLRGLGRVPRGAEGQRSAAPGRWPLLPGLAQGARRAPSPSARSARATATGSRCGRASRPHDFPDAHGDHRGAGRQPGRRPANGCWSARPRRSRQDSYLPVKVGLPGALVQEALHADLAVLGAEDLHEQLPISSANAAGQLDGRAPLSTARLASAWAATAPLATSAARREGPLVELLGRRRPRRRARSAAPPRH